jgi:hypothetical protein
MISDYNNLRYFKGEKECPEALKEATPPGSQPNELNW